MSEIGRPSDVREDYHQVLLEIQEQCAAYGMVFAHEMRMLSFSWYVTHCRRRGLERDQEIVEPETDGSNTPGLEIMENAMKTATKPTGRIIKAPNPTHGRFAMHHSNPPEINGEGKMHSGPDVAELVTLGRQQWVSIPCGEISFDTLVRRVSQANGARKKSAPSMKMRLICWQNDDGTMVVRNK